MQCGELWLCEYHFFLQMSHLGAADGDHLAMQGFLFVAIKQFDRMGDHVFALACDRTTAGERHRIAGIEQGVHQLPDIAGRMFTQGRSARDESSFMPTQFQK